MTFFLKNKAAQLFFVNICDALGFKSQLYKRLICFLKLKLQFSDSSCFF